jgi:hypothetical protein
MGNQDELYKKLSSLKDLKHAIKTVKKTLTAAEPAPAKEIKKSAEPKVETPQPESEHKLKYIGRKKLSNGVLSHMIGSAEPEAHHYQMDVDLDKHSKALPCVSISVVSPKGEIIDQHEIQHKNIKDAIGAVVHHSIKKAWNKK